MPFHHCQLCLHPIAPTNPREVPVCDQCRNALNDPDVALEVSKLMLWGLLVDVLGRLVDEAERRHTGPDELFGGMN